MKVFDATLSLQKEALDRASLHRCLRRFPWMTAKTCLAIYWQALRLFLKRTPIFSIRPPRAPRAPQSGIPRIAAMKSPNLSVKANRLNVNGMTTALLRKGVLRQLSQLRHGQLVVIEDGERQVFGAREAHLLGEIQILDPAVWGLVAANGSIGAGEAFIHGYWTSPDLTAVVRVMVSKPRRTRRHGGWPGQAGRPFTQGLHWLNRNTRKGSQKNIAAHYDLGNDLFEEFLDPTMMYSAAQFEPRRQPGTGATEQAGTHLPETGAQAHRSPAGNRHRLGQHGAVCGAAVWLQGHHHDLVQGAVRYTDASKPWGCKARSPCCCITAT
jgi:hypothetical protein